MPYVNPSLLKIAIIGEQANLLRETYDLYGLVRLDTTPRTLFNLEASLNFELIDPKKADCIFIFSLNGEIPPPEHLALIKEQIKGTPETLTLVVSFISLHQPSHFILDYPAAQNSWKEALGRNIEILPLPDLHPSVTHDKLAARYQFLDKLKRYLIYAGLLSKQLKNDESYAVHHMHNNLVNIVCEYIGNPIEEEGASSSPAMQG